MKLSVLVIKDLNRKEREQKEMEEASLFLVNGYDDFPLEVHCNMKLQMGL